MEGFKRGSDKKVSTVSKMALLPAEEQRKEEANGKRGKACLGTEHIESLCASSEFLKRYWQPKEKIRRFRKIHKSLWQVPKLVKLV